MKRLITVLAVGMMCRLPMAGETVGSEPTEGSVISELQKAVVAREEAPASAAKEKKEKGGKPLTDPVEAASEFYRRKDTVMAIALLDNMLSRADLTRDVKARALLLRGLIALETGKTSEASVRFNAWIEQFPDRKEAAQVYLILGQCYRELQANFRAREAFYRTLTANAAKLTKTNPNESLTFGQSITQMAWWEIAETEYQTANWERADQQFQRFRDKHPENMDLCNTAIYRQADCSYQMGQTKAATQRYELAISMAPFHLFAAEAWLRLMMLYAEQGDAQRQSEALESFVWLVRNLFQDQESYWQQRCASVLLDLLKSNPKQQAAFLNQVNGLVDNHQWKSIFNYYTTLIQRVDAEAAKEVKATQSKEDGWMAWRAAYGKMQSKLESQVQQVMESPPQAGAKMPKPGP